MSFGRGVLFRDIAAGAVVAGGAFLHKVALPDSPELAFFASLLSGGVATAILTMLGRYPL